MRFFPLHEDRVPTPIPSPTTLPSVFTAASGGLRELASSEFAWERACPIGAGSEGVVSAVPFRGAEVCVKVGKCELALPQGWSRSPCLGARLPPCSGAHGCWLAWC